MKKDTMQSECNPTRGTTAPEHWLYANMPDNHAELQREVSRLQRTIAALIAVGAITEEKARQAYAIAGW
jgi:hypothetical protein